VPIDPPGDIELELVESTGDVDLGDAAVRRPGDPLKFTFVGELWYWRGPSPYHFITVPHDAADAIHGIAANVTYGWGMIPATVRIGGSTWATALWPKDGGYVVPIKDAYRNAEGLTLGERVAVQLVIRQ
jgi:hypothetical protein